VHAQREESGADVDWAREAVEVGRRLAGMVLERSCCPQRLERPGEDGSRRSVTCSMKHQRQDGVTREQEGAGFQRCVHQRGGGTLLVHLQARKVTEDGRGVANVDLLRGGVRGDHWGSASPIERVARRGVSGREMGVWRGFNGHQLVAQVRGQKRGRWSLVRVPNKKREIREGAMVVEGTGQGCRTC
jgi:hypothetical protein